MKVLSVFILSLLICGLSLSKADAFAITQYNDMASWMAAVGGSFTEENLNSYTDRVRYDVTSVDVGDFTVSHVGLGWGGHWHTLGNAASAARDLNGTGQMNAATRDGGETLLDYDLPIYAWGATFKVELDDWDTSIIVGGETLPLPRPLDRAFLGFVADGSFTNLKMKGVVKSGEGFALDDIVYAHEAAVPEPATVALLGIGIAGIAGAEVRRRLKKKVVDNS